MTKLETPQYECPGCKHRMNLIPNKCPRCDFDFTKQKPKRVECKGKIKTVLLEQ